MARKAFYNLRPLLKDEYKVSKEVFEKMLCHLRIAALLHDVGHAPFSHLGEKYYRKKEIKLHLKEVIDLNNLKINNKIFESGSSHELMSCYVTLKKYAEVILKYNNTIDFELICRAIVGAKYINWEEKWLENIIVELINSDTIDTDKLDYLMRDAFMTGVNVPSIDTTRLFRNIYVNPRLKTITFKNRAIPVIQNIIDARDSMYLWVYNHHSVVYTDFVFEFYIKHLAVNEEKNNKFDDKLKLDDFFSCNAICELKVSDSDLRKKLKEPLQVESKMSKYTTNIYPQLFERKFLKPLWKTIYEYREFIRNNSQDSRMIKQIEQRMCDSDYVYRRYMAKKIISECNLNLGEVFIVPRSNKFYSLNPEKNVFNVYVNSGDKDLKDLLPQKNFGDLYTNVNFYVFVLESKLDIVRSKFIVLLRKPLPNKESLPQDATKLEWFNKF